MSRFLGTILFVIYLVIGVVVAESTLYAYNPGLAQKETVSQSDIAIALPVLRDFLGRNGIRYRSDDNMGLLAAHRVEDRAEEFVVNILCLQ